MSIKNKHFAGAVIGALSLVLVACGGGSSGGGNEGGTPAQPTNQAPSVTVESISLMEGESATITASATDPEGSAVSYAWEQKSGVSLELADVDTATVSIQVPAVTEDSQTTLVVTATDAEGAKTSKEVVVSIVARMVGFDIEGMVTESLAAEAEISFSVGEQIFTSEVDATGQYLVSINVDDSRVADLVRAEVTNPGTKLKLVSLLGNVESVIAAAGVDELVTHDELLSVNVSSLTTAMAAVIEEGELGNVSTQEQFVGRKKLVDGYEAFQLATLIELVQSYSESAGVTIPSDIDDTYALVANREIAALLLAEVRSNNPDTYQAAMDAILGDSQLVVTAPAGNSEIQDTYYFTTSNIDLGARLELAPEGLGSLSGSSFSGKSEITWTATAEGLELYGADTVLSSLYEFDENLGRNVLEEVVFQPKLVNWLDHGTEVDWLVVQAEEFTRYPNGEYPPSEPELKIVTPIAIRNTGKVDAADFLQMGLSLSIPLPSVASEVTEPTPDQEQSLSAESVQLTFAGNLVTGGSVSVNVDSISGSGVPSSIQVSSPWEIDINGHLLIDNVLGYKAELVLLEGDNQKSPLVFVELDNGARALSTSGKAYLKEAPAWTPDRAVGMYQYPMSFSAPLEPFWFEVNADGTALTASTWDRNGDGEITADETSLMPGLWRINEAGNLLIRRYFAYTSGFCESAIWDPAPGDECALYHEREWVLHQEGEGIAVRNYHRFFLDPFLDESMAIPEEHILSSASIFNAYFERVEERPVPISGM
ncbi:PKD domain-containing protein [Microbulbifer mangrovi]|uniref:PKD domain-containing protein n=1 Tax=Microbulbifer mangrovi TaxID=927787 RepID=UPI0009908922|nr:hypothetical protein [Microbulbifer mangrovi]